MRWRAFRHVRLHAGRGITAAHQHMLHLACDFAKEAMQVAYAGTGFGFPMERRTFCPFLCITRKLALGHFGRADRGQSESRASGVEAPLRTRQAFAGKRFLSGLGSAPAQLVTRYAAGVFIFSGEPGRGV